MTTICEHCGASIYFDFRPVCACDRCGWRIQNPLPWRPEKSREPMADRALTTDELRLVASIRLESDGKEVQPVK